MIHCSKNCWTIRPFGHGYGTLQVTSPWVPTNRSALNNLALPAAASLCRSSSLNKQVPSADAILVGDHHHHSGSFRRWRFSSRSPPVLALLLRDAELPPEPPLPRPGSSARPSSVFFSSFSSSSSSKGEGDGDGDRLVCKSTWRWKVWQSQIPPPPQWDANCNVTQTQSLKSHWIVAADVEEVPEWPYGLQVTVAARSIPTTTVSCKLLCDPDPEFEVSLNRSCRRRRSARSIVVSGSPTRW